MRFATTKCLPPCIGSSSKVAASGLQEHPLTACVVPQDAEFFERKRSRRGGPPGNGIPKPAPAARNGPADVPMEALEGEEAPAAQQGPTMMSAEARRLVQGEGGLELWKVRP